MSRVITFSLKFPSYHNRKGESTHFVEKIWNSICWDDGVQGQEFPIPYHLGIDFRNTDEKKHHTIRAGHRFKVGDWFSPRVWGNDLNPKSGKSGPYHSKQIVIAPDIQIKKIWSFEIIDGWAYLDDGKGVSKSLFIEIAKNDGLTFFELKSWFKYPKSTGKMQIICWNENIEYE